MLLAFISAEGAWAQATIAAGATIDALDFDDGIILENGAIITDDYNMGVTIYPTKADYDNETNGEDIVNFPFIVNNGVGYVTYLKDGWQACMIPLSFIDDSETEDIPNFEIKRWGKKNDKFYSTIVLGKNWIVPLECITYYIDENLTLRPYIEGSASKGFVVKAGTPLIIESYNDTPITIYTTDETKVPSIGKNLLRGVLKDTRIPEENNVKFYKLSYNQEGKNLGFYWDGTTNDEGATINAKDHRAYLRVEGNSGSSNYLALRFDDTITAIEAISAENESQNIYDLWGKRTNNQNGIVIKDGKKMLVK